MPVVDVKPATTLEEVASQIEEAMSYSVDHYTRVCDVVLGQWLMMCRSIDDELLELADEMDSAEEDGLLVRDSDLMEWARRIREALGVTDG